MSELKGVIYKMLPMVTGTSARGTWSKLEMVIEQPGEYPKKALIEFWGDKAELAETKLAEGMEITAHINIEAREHNGRWYNTVRCWKFDTNEAANAGGYMPPQAGAGSATTAAAPTQSASAAPAAGEDPDDLPF